MAKKLEDQIIIYTSSLDSKIFGLQSITDIKIQPLLGGYHNSMYVLLLNKHSKFVVRFSLHNETGTDRIAEEWASMKKIQNVRIPSCLFIGVPDFLGSSIMITDFIKGEHKKFDSISDSEVSCLAENIARLHQNTLDMYSVALGAPPTQLGTHFNYLRSSVESSIIRRLDKIDPLYLAEAEENIKKGLEQINQLSVNNAEFFERHMFSLLHTDVNENNIIWQAGVPVFIDWEDVTYGDPADEIGYIFAINNASQLFKETFLSKYMQLSDDLDIPARVKVYELKNRLFDLIWSIGKLAESDKNRPLYCERLDSLRHAVAQID